MSTEEPGAFHFLREHLSKMVAAKANEQKASFWDRMAEQVRREAEDERIRIASATAIAEQILEDNVLGAPSLLMSPYATPALCWSPVQDQSGVLGPDGTFEGFLGELKDKSWADLFKENPGAYIIEGENTSPYTIATPIRTGKHYAGYMGRDGIVRTEEVEPNTVTGNGEPVLMDKSDPMRGLKFIQDFLASAQGLMAALDDE